MARTPGSSEQNERRRRRSIEIVFKEGRVQSDAAKELKVHLRTVQKWVHLYRLHGEDGIKSRKASGRPRKLGVKEIERFEKLLLKGALAAGFSNDLWTSKRIVEVIRRNFKVSYHQNHLPKLLRALGWSAQRPSRRPIERDEKQIKEWIRIEWRRIKKKP